ncbi:MAG: hypothetical protein ACRDT0_03500 [Pseudonocardiaceae bacterium]
MDLDIVTDELYALPRDEFIAARDERVREARSEGDRELAAEIGRLRKPSMAAWLANLLARQQPDEIHGLVELGDALRQAHSELDGETLRRLSGQRRELVAALAGKARQLGRSAGHRVSEGVSRELEDTFTAALGNPDAARLLAAGRLTSSLQAGANDDWSWIPDGGQQADGDRGARKPRRERAEADQPEADQHSGRPQQQRRHGQERDRLRRDLDSARRAASDAEASAQQAADALTRAERNEDEANQAVTDRRTELEAAERAAEEAADEKAAARRSHEAADRQARETQQRVDDLDRQVDRLRD